MKKALLLGIAGLAAAAATTYAQGNIFLDNYFLSTYNPVMMSGGGLVPTTFTAGIYYDPTAGQDITAAFNTAAASASPTADPSSLAPSLQFASGTGATAPFILPGYFAASASFNIQPSGNPSTFSVVVVAYNGADYASSTIRGYSEAVLVTAAAPSVGNGGDIGTFFPANTTMFSVHPVPEPTTMALGGLGLAALALIRRKKA